MKRRKKKKKEKKKLERTTVASVTLLTAKLRLGIVAAVLVSWTLAEST